MNGVSFFGRELRVLKKCDHVFFFVFWLQYNLGMIFRVQWKHVIVLTAHALARNFLFCLQKQNIRTYVEVRYSQSVNINMSDLLYHFIEVSPV